MKFLRNVAIASLCVVFALPALGAKGVSSDSENFGRCKRAAKVEFGATSKVKLMRLMRARGGFKARMSVMEKDINEGHTFRVSCVIDKTGTLTMESPF